MSIHKPVHDIHGFCQSLLASGLVSESLLDKILADFRSQASDSRYGVTLTAFTTHLVSKGVITCWQYSKLRNGQYRGFFMDEYKLVDYLGDDDRCNRYLVEDTRTAKCAVLCVVPPSIAPMDAGKCPYWIEEFDREDGEAGY